MKINYTSGRLIEYNCIENNNTETLKETVVKSAIAMINLKD